MSVISEAEGAAREVLAAEYDRSGDTYSAMLVSKGEPDFLEDMVIRAMLAFAAAEVAAERERCAGVVEFDCRSDLAKSMGYIPPWFEYAKAIAAAIRDTEGG